MYGTTPHNLPRIEYFFTLSHFIDFLVWLVIVVYLAAESVAAEYLKPIRALRALKPLRILSQFKGMKQVSYVKQCHAMRRLDSNKPSSNRESGLVYFRSPSCDALRRSARPPASAFDTSM